MILPLPLRRWRVRRKSTLFAVFLFTLSLLYFIQWRLHKSKNGRWYWNYCLTIHPALAYIIPGGDWGGLWKPEPRWIPEINSAPWMGTFSPAQLTKPTYDANGSYTSPAILKLHVFSTVQAKAWEKRRQLRKFSPLFNLPLEYRHLVEIKFVLGHAYREDWSVDTELEILLEEEQRLYGDLNRLNLVHGENLREGKILDWINAAGRGTDGGREGWYLFKVDDDTVLNLPLFLDSLLELDPHDPIYLGTSLNRWPAFHHHFTGMLTGFSWPLVKTLSAGISNMSREDIEVWYDDDVLTGEIMFGLPSGPQCDSTTHPKRPAYCDPHRPPPWGYKSNPPRVDPRTSLIRHDYVRRLGDEVLPWIKGDIARHSWWFKFQDRWEKEWHERIEGVMWEPPAWLEAYKEDMKVD